ncbi:MAG TPA: quinolinate synthase NadA, partial [Arachnia sp.]|nr:quinolinate synthase NadA [Arachnia sp.]HMT87770.1 quinolinate synthase NadA [Arachnia sp.]
SLGVPEVIMIPDQFLAANVARQTGVRVITHPGACEVHERFTPRDIRQIRADYPDGVTVLAHPECPPEIVDEADYAGSTAQMISFVAERRPRRVALITECSMSDNVAQEYPDVEFVRPCNLCPHMKRNTLGAIRHALETMTHEVTIDPAVAARARASVDRMLEVR